MKRLTGEEMETIRRLYEKGLPMREIIEKTGRSYGSIYSVVLRFKLRQRKKRLTEEERAKIRELYGKGLTIKEVAERVKRSSSTVRLVLEPHEIRRVRRGWVGVPPCRIITIPKTLLREAGLSKNLKMRWLVKRKKLLLEIAQKTAFWGTIDKKRGKNIW